MQNNIRRIALCLRTKRNATSNTTVQNVFDSNWLQKTSLKNDNPRRVPRLLFFLSRTKVKHRVPDFCNSYYAKFLAVSIFFLIFSILLSRNRRQANFFSLVCFCVRTSRNSLVGDLLFRFVLLVCFRCFVLFI